MAKVVKKSAPAKPAPKAPPKAPVKPSPKAAVKPAVKPVAKSSSKPAAKAAVKPAAKPAAKPVAKVPVKVAAKPVAKAPVKVAAKPVAKAPVKVSAKPVAKVPVKVAVKPVAKASVKAAAPSLPAKPAPKPPPKPLAKAPVKPVPASNRKPVAEPAKAVNGRHPFLTKADLEDFRKSLLNFRDRLVDEIGFLSGDNLARNSREASGDLSNYSLHMADQGTDNFDREFALNLVSGEHDVLYEIDEALQRIDAGTYGVCEMTQQPIEKERLKVIPYARYSVKAQAEIERGKTKYRPFGPTLSQL